jgi:hypothetical protein
MGNVYFYMYNFPIPFVGFRYKNRASPYMNLKIKFLLRFFPTLFTVLLTVFLFRMPSEMCVGVWSQVHV